MPNEETLLDLLVALVERAPGPLWGSWILVCFIALITAFTAVFIAQRLTASVLGTFALVAQTIVGWFTALRRARAEIDTLNTRIAHAKTAVSGDGVWLTTPIQQPENYQLVRRNSIPILTLANLKGGVGKSTLAANIAASYAARDRAPVLLIDLDFQGSLTGICATTPEEYSSPNGAMSQATRVIRGDLSSNDLIAASQSVGGAPDVRLLPSYFDMAQAENWLLVHWLLKEPVGDVRYTLAQALLDHDIQHHFSRVIIDAPPRLSTAGIQALCASTEILIPTILDPTSGNAVGTMLTQIENHHQSVMPNLRRISVVGTLTQYDLGSVEVELEGAELDLENAVKDHHSLSKRVPIRILPRKVFVPRRTTIARAPGSGIAYVAEGDTLEVRNIRHIFDRLRDAIDAET